MSGIPGLKVTRPEGTFYCFADFRPFDDDCSRLAARLLDKVQVDGRARKGKPAK